MTSYTHSNRWKEILAHSCEENNNKCSKHEELLATVPYKKKICNNHLNLIDEFKACTSAGRCLTAGRHKNKTENLVRNKKNMFHFANSLGTLNSASIRYTHGYIIFFVGTFLCRSECSFVQEASHSCESMHNSIWKMRFTSFTTVAPPVDLVETIWQRIQHLRIFKSLHRSLGARQVSKSRKTLQKRSLCHVLCLVLSTVPVSDMTS